MSLNQSAEEFLKDIQIASPCPMNWDDMARTSDEAKRFCGDCKKNVFSIDQMSAKEAHALIQNACSGDSSVCVRLFKRADGTIITDDCPVGLRRIRNTWRQLKSSVATAMVLLGALPAMGKDDDTCKSNAPPLLGRAMPIVKPQTNRPPALMGEPMMIDYRAEACKIPAIKSLADKIDDLEKKKSKSSSDQIQIVKLRLNMAREGMGQKLYMFASQELSTDLPLARTLPDQSEADKNAKKSLTREVLKEKLTCLKQLKLGDTEKLQQQLNALK